MVYRQTDRQFFDQLWVSRCLQPAIYKVFHEESEYEVQKSKILQESPKFFEIMFLKFKTDQGRYHLHIASVVVVGALRDHLAADAPGVSYAGAFAGGPVPIALLGLWLLWELFALVELHLVYKTKLSRIYGRYLDFLGCPDAGSYALRCRTQLTRFFSVDFLALNAWNCLPQLFVGGSRST